MKATELRIGNWVIDQDGEQSQVMSILINGTHRWWNPIPLTVEWLERFGFDVYDLQNRKRAYQNNFNINLFKRGDIKISYKHRQLSIDLKYVHQLQNLYFALTSEELQIKSDEKHPNN